MNILNRNKNKHPESTLRKAAAIILPAAIICCSCIDNYLPEQLDAYDRDAAFTQTVYRPSLGRTTLMTNNFNSGSSTLPYTFEITNITRYDGSPAPELTDYFPVKTWKLPYTGKEKSLAEIEEKRTVENRQLFQIRKHTGEFILWSKANSSFVLCAPERGYIFDVLSQNSGGYKYTEKMSLEPVREVDYEPSNYDPNTGLAISDHVNPATVSRMVFEQVSSSFGYSYYYYMSPEDIHVFFRKNDGVTDNDKTLTFRFYRQDYTAINPDRFNLTEWDKLVHGFDMEKTADYVRYKVAYPIPLVETLTGYTDATGSKAHTVFAYDYMSGTMRNTASFSLDFAIYTEGHWEIIFYFASGNPVFGDDSLN
ncbi:MAG: DUF5007 domain-containing protein [Prevotellaceae bacterium]|nr:DUF5007 domain-containing protein [Prevotellaceae bacterium]